MATTYWSGCRHICMKVSFFLLEKFPFINALTLLMLLAERAVHESYPPINPQLIYINLGLFVLCGFLFSTKLLVKEASLIYTGQLLYFAYNFYTNSRFQYDKWQKIQMSTRQIGCSGIYLLLGDFFVRTDRRKSQQHRAVELTQWQRVGEILIGLCCLSSSFILNYSEQHRDAFLQHFWHSQWLHYLLTLVLLGGALCFISGYFIQDVFLCLIPAVTLLTVVVDGDLKYWTEHNVHYWNQVRMLVDNVCLILGFIFFSSVSYRRTHTSFTF